MKKENEIVEQPRAVYTNKELFNQTMLEIIKLPANALDWDTYRSKLLMLVQQLEVYGQEYIKLNPKYKEELEEFARIDHMTHGTMGSIDENNFFKFKKIIEAKALYEEKMNA